MASRLTGMPYSASTAWHGLQHERLARLAFEQSPDRSTRPASVSAVDGRAAPHRLAEGGHGAIAAAARAGSV